MRCDLNIRVCGIMIASAILGLGTCFADTMAEKQARWTELENYGIARFNIRLEPKKATTNNTALTMVECDNESDRKWFCEMVAFSMPTNDAEAYSSWMYHKTQLIGRAIYSQNTEASVKSWRQLAAFLADMKARRGSGDSAQFIQKHREDWKKSHRLLTMEDWGEWRKAYMRARWFRSTWGRAFTDTECAMENLARQLQPSQKKVLGEIILEYTGKKPDWYLDEKKKSDNRQPTTTSP